MPELDIKSDYRFIPGEINIKDYKSETDLNGSININSVNSNSDLNGQLDIPVERSAYLDSRIEVNTGNGEIDLDGLIYIPGFGNITSDLNGQLDIPSDRKSHLDGTVWIPGMYGIHDFNGSININTEFKGKTDIEGLLKIREYETTKSLSGTIFINSILGTPEDLSGSVYVNNEANLEGTLKINPNYFFDVMLRVPPQFKTIKGKITIKDPVYYDIFDIDIDIPDPEKDLIGTLITRAVARAEFAIDIEVPNPDIDLPGSIIVVKYTNEDLFNINIRVPINVKPEPYLPIEGDFIIEIPFPYKQFIDTEFFLTETKTNLFIPRRFYERYDDYHLLLSNELNLSVGDEIRFIFLHNDAKFHIQKMEFYFKAQGNASYYYFDIISPYKKKIEDSDIKYKVYVNRREIILNTDYKIDNEYGILEFMNDDLARNPEDRIDVICFYTGIDDTAVADLPMSGYIYLKRNMIDRNYNNNLMATFINGKLIQRDKILHISNNIYKVKEDIKSRHDLQILNMSNCIDCMVPFYKQSSKFPFTQTLIQDGEIVDNFNPRYMEYSFPITIATTEPRDAFGRQHMSIYQNPVYFSPQFLLENKNLYLSFVHIASEMEDLDYTLTFYNDDFDEFHSEEMKVKVELHIKTPFEDEMEESRTSVLLCTLPSQVKTTDTEYCYASLQIKRIIELDMWKNRFLEMCDGISIRIEPSKTYQNQPSEVYFEMTTNKFENYENEQIKVFEYRITDSYDGLGTILYSKTLSFNPEENIKNVIKASEDGRLD